MLLAIDTSTRYAAVALADDQRVVDVQAWYSTVNHTSELMPAVADLMSRRGIAPSGLDGIAIALGPGGFSALRVGMSAAKGLAMAAKLPVVGVATLDLEAFPYAGSGLNVCPMLDAGRGEVATAYLGPDGARQREDLICSPDEALDLVSEATLFCGEGVGPYSSLVRERLGPLAVVVTWPGPAARVGALVEMARRQFENGEQDDLATLQPYYLRMPSIGAPKQRDRTPQRS